MVLLERAAIVLPLTGAAAVAAIAYFFSRFVARFIARRRFYRNVPCPPHSFLWGHLALFGKYMACMPKGGYLAHAIFQIKKDYDMPDVFYLDMWPVIDGLLCLASPEATAYPTTANPWPLPSVVADFLGRATGYTFIEVTNGPLWKELLHHLAPSLTPNNIKAYFPAIVDAACNLRDALASKSGANHPAIRFQEVNGRFPFDVVSEVLFGQVLSDEVYQQVSLLTEMQKLEQQEQSQFRMPWQKWESARKWAACLSVIEAELLVLIRARFAVLQGDKTVATQGPIDRMLLPRVKEGLPLDETLEELCLSNAKGFIIAGYGTTTDTTVYIWLLLQAHPEILEKLREEHDRVFGKDLDATIAKLREKPSILKSLHYTTAVIHETLRLYPIGMPVREAPADVTSITISGTQYPILPKMVSGIVAHAMHYNEEFFPEAKRFLPDRFLNDSTASALAFDDEDDKASNTTAKAAQGKGLPSYPRNAYRPFERGPRACLGQALAMEEMKVQLVVLARSFDMQLELGGDWNGEDKSKPFKPTFAHNEMEEKLGKHAFQVSCFTAMPAGPVMMKVRPAVR